MTLIDRFEGEQLGENKASQAFRLRYRHKSETLTDDQVQPVHDKVRKPLKNSTGPSSGADLPQQKRQIFQMGGLREEIHGLQLIQLVRPSRLQQPFQISGLGRHVAAEVGQQAGGSLRITSVTLESSPRRGGSTTSAEHVGRVSLSRSATSPALNWVSAPRPVRIGIATRLLDRVGIDFKTHNTMPLGCQRQADGADAAVGVDDGPCELRLA